MFMQSDWGGSHPLGHYHHAWCLQGKKSHRDMDENNSFHFVVCEFLRSYETSVWFLPLGEISTCVLSSVVLYFRLTSVENVVGFGAFGFVCK